MAKIAEIVPEIEEDKVDTLEEPEVVSVTYGNGDMSGVILNAEKYMPRALPGSGAISLYNVNTELLRSGSQSINMNDGQVRTLAQVPSGSYGMNSFHGKSALHYGQNYGHWINYTSWGSPFDSWSPAAACTLVPYYPYARISYNINMVVKQNENRSGGGSSPTWQWSGRVNGISYAYFDEGGTGSELGDVGDVPGIDGSNANTIQSADHTFIIDVNALPEGSWYQLWSYHMAGIRNVWLEYFVMKSGGTLQAMFRFRGDQAGSDRAGVRISARGYVGVGSSIL